MRLYLALCCLSVSISHVAYAEGDSQNSNASAARKQILKDFAERGAAVQRKYYQDKPVAPPKASAQRIGAVSGAAKPVVSLIADCESEESAWAELRRLVELSETNRVVIGDIVLVGLEQRTERYYSKLASLKDKPPIPSLLSRIMSTFALQPKNFVSPNALQQRLQFTKLPVWVVRDEGVDHVFEGPQQQPSRFFTREGKFIVPAQGRTVEEKSATDSFGSSYLTSGSTKILRYNAASGSIKPPKLSQIEQVLGR